MSLFTYISGVISVLGFLLQLRDVFPKHRELRKTILLLVTGAFIGSIVASLQGIQINIKTPDSPLILMGYVFLAIFAGILTIAAIAYMVTVDDNRRQSFKELLAAGFTGFLFLAFLVAMLSSANSKGSPGELTIDELITLSNNSVSLKNYDRGIALLEMAMSKVSQYDARENLLLTRIQELKKAQVAVTEGK